eukprot:6558454-Alexandrium_andersonii.AAC.1
MRPPKKLLHAAMCLPLSQAVPPYFRDHLAAKLNNPCVLIGQPLLLGNTLSGTRGHSSVLNDLSFVAAVLWPARRCGRGSPSFSEARCHCSRW